MHMTSRCKQCGKPFPTRQEWCNWCEPEQAVGEIPDENGVVVSAIGSVFMFLLKGFCILIGLMLIAGGGLLSLCGTLGGASGFIWVLLGMVSIALGYYVFVLVSGKSSPPQNEMPQGAEAPIADTRQPEER